ncbi:MAG: sulfotransferase domain-containing protein, partial [Nitrospirota bacterium]|nr:sulfotransferase domain-containing protein [Nitrospirota bacterium]
GKLDKVMYAHGLRSSRTLCLPDFLGIGPPKTGTTWLSENLRCHPDIFISQEKEIHYFNRDFHRGLRFYSEKFEAGGGRVKGEITPEYYRLPLERIKFISAIMPKVKLLILLRNPVDRAWSHAVMNFTLANKSISDADEKTVCKEFENQPLFKLGGYAQLLKAWCSIFPREQLYIGLYDDIKIQPRELLARVFGHIGVTSNVDWSLFPYNDVIIPPVGEEYRNYDKRRGVKVKGYKGTRHSMPDVYRDRLKNMVRRDIELLRENFGLDVDRWLTS